MFQTWSKMLAAVFGYDSRKYIKITPEQLFQRDVTIVCTAFGVDTTNPEIQRVKGWWQYYADTPFCEFSSLLRELNPERSVVPRHTNSRTVHVQIRKSWIYCPWTLARHYVRSLDACLGKIVVERTRVCLYDHSKRLIFVYGAVVVGSLYELSDFGAVAIVHEFTGQSIDWRSSDSERMIARVTIERDNRGSWKPYEFSYESAGM